MKYKYQKNAGIHPQPKKNPIQNITQTEDILKLLKSLWKEKEQYKAIKENSFQKYKEYLGKEQEVQRKINELLKQNAERG